ncbi:exodeoxyribonuclease VII small subunit [Candidatus Woesebacteria bacterium]|nr:exodeoxyribonuclease VII small subunit [Candidatus Woesebacteria bacterium]MCD8526878.1 exodeoxyribonuclease VII small subunit [Candidatus Woesebacteria bacterium]MCD8545784.1 exodeoxyribonuclease VII small subunit [Candidatus Woesebacteria bacterium]
MASNPTFNFSDSMKEIDQINEWFQQDDLDLEEALTKLKRGKELIKLCKTRLKDVENEFKELKEDFFEEPRGDISNPNLDANEVDELSFSESTKF